MTAAPRDKAQRKARALELLTAKDADCWVATAGEDGPYLVPLSFVWTDERAVLAGRASSRTIRNIVAAGNTRLGLGHTRDVVMLDATLERTVPVAEAGTLGDAYAKQSDWDPREDQGDYVYVVLRPTRIQAWRESNEQTGRLLMRDGVWLV